MNIKALEYNSQREGLIISEYGRHVQNIIQHAKTLDSDEDRQSTIEGVVKLMAQMNPQIKSTLDFETRLWNHVFRIADYDLNVKVPEGVEIIPDSEIQRTKLKYPQKEFRFRHYGSNIQILIDKAVALEAEPEKQQEFVKIIAAYMKLAYRTWNREHFVNDEIIKSDIQRLSNNKLSLEDDYNINNLSNNNRRRSNANQRRGRKTRSNSNQRQNNNRNNNRRK